MAPPKSAKSFPTLKTYMRLNSLNSPNEQVQFFDVEFYPFTEPGLDPIFAVVGGSEAIVCKPGRNEIDTLAWFKDDDPKNNFNSCCWSVDYETGDPLLIVAGSRPVITVFNVRTRERVFGIAGHGKAVNALVTSPLAPNILASASFDKTVRIWSLDPVHRKQPCMVICGGEGHKEGLQTMAFHESGRFLLTGGFDNMVNCWVIPELPSKDAGSDRVTTIHYPHFSSMAIHTDFVDCVAWHGDLILSKCAREEKIVLWRIEKFDSNEPLPEPLPAPTTYEFHPTRSAWGGSFQRLLEFEVPEASLSWIRFELFPGLDPADFLAEPLVKQELNTAETGASNPNYKWSGWSGRPLLAVGNTKSKVVFWDLEALEDWVPSAAGSALISTPNERRKRGGARTAGVRKSDSAASRAIRAAGELERSGSDLSPADSLLSTPDTFRRRGEAVPSSAQAAADSAGRPSALDGTHPDSPPASAPPLGAAGKQPWKAPKQELRGGERFFGTREPFQPLKSHAHAIVPRVSFCVRQVAWSQGGEWMVAVGDQGMVALFGR